MKKFNKLTISALALPAAIIPAISITSCNKNVTTTTFEIDNNGLVTIKDLSLKEAKIPSVINDIKVQGIASNGFKDSKVEYVTFENPNQITKIYDNAFKGCSNLKSFTVPKNVTYLGSSAFSGCVSLTECSFANGCKLQELKERTFEDTAIVNITIPSSIVVMEKNLFAHSGASKLIKMFFQTTVGWKQNDVEISETEMKGPDNCANHFLNFNKDASFNWGYTGIVRTVKQASIDFSNLPESWTVTSRLIGNTINEKYADNTIIFDAKAKQDQGGVFVIWVTTNTGYTLAQDEFDIGDTVATTTTVYLTVTDWTYITSGDTLYVRAMKKVS